MTKLSIHPLFFFIILLAFLHGFIYEVLLLFTIVLIHECGHAVVAYSLGWRIKKIELLPFGGAAEVEEYGNRPLREEALVIIAGPIMNVVMIAISWLLLTINMWSGKYALQFIEYNLFILGFNLLPIWPLDGGKLLQQFLCLLLPYKRAIRYSFLISIISLFLFVLFVILYLPLYFYLWSIAVFLSVSLFLEYRQHPYQYLRFLLARYQTKETKDKHVGLHRNNVMQTIIIYPHYSVKQSLDGLYRQKTHYFCLLNQQGNLIHMFKEDELLRYYFERKWIHRAVGDILG